MNPDLSREEGHVFKIVLLGDGGVGKTALKERFLGRGFRYNLLSTIGADFSTYRTQINKEKVKMLIWDLAGQQRFIDVRKSFYQGALGALMVFDVTRAESADSLLEWEKELQKNLKIPVNIVVAGNKIDLRGEFPNSLTAEDGQTITLRLSRQQGEKKVQYFETSAKENMNVHQAFTELASAILSNR
ncbi:MAG: Rab family GTPase [Candidatus Hodarchaeales archaeon]|jgi:small GTP-binding protein